MSIKVETWVGWIGGIAVTLVASVFALVTFAYGNFETKENSKEWKQGVCERLTRIEDKLDEIRKYSRGIK